jgi:[amino group carrier protein]-6-phospho-L-2-aminoadipate/5-phospho-L-glutamate reductase
MAMVAVLGASGYAGGELIRILLRHPKADLVSAVSRRHAGEYLFRAHPNLRGTTEMKFSSPGADLGGADLVFSALPHGESVKSVPQLADSGLKVVDLSADFRLADPAGYVEWYGFEHPRPDLLAKFVFALPEIDREGLKGASLASSPGCMAIASILALAPLFREEPLAVGAERVVVDTKVGSSGAGGKPSVSTHFSERYGVVRPYKPAGHRHSPEVERAIESVSGRKAQVSISAHGVNIVRGILSTSHVFSEASPTPIDIWRAYRKMYEESPFVRLVRDRKGPFRYPDPKLVVGSNFCDIGFELEPRTGRIVALAAIDNLVKGAAGNAVQAMNLMLGYPETAGLDAIPIHPV